MLDMNKIEEIYGKSIFNNIKNNLEDLTENIKYLQTKKFNNIEEIIEQNPYLFIMPNDIFIERLDNLIENLGNNYIEILNEDITLWDYLFE